MTHQLAGAVLLLAAYLTHLSTPDPGRPSALYLLSNIAGSGMLAVDAYSVQQWGFVLLEGMWCLASSAQLIRAGFLTVHQGVCGVDR